MLSHSELVEQLKEKDKEIALLKEQELIGCVTFNNQSAEVEILKTRITELEEYIAINVTAD